MRGRLKTVIFSDFRDGLETVHPFHQKIHEDCIGIVGFEFLKRLFTRFRHDHIIKSILGQQAAQHDTGGL